MKTLRPAIGMIELIFAIMVMGIVLLPVPMLLQQATESGFVAIQQEGINEAASQTNMVLGYHWDENDTDERYIDPILSVIAGDSNLNEFNNTGRRIGTPQESKRSFVRDDSQRFVASVLGSDSNDSDDMDDFIGSWHLWLAENVTNHSDYAERTTINIATTVNYINDTVAGGYQGTDITFSPSWANAGGTTNIKHIQVTLTSTSGTDELNKTIILHAFSSNIGGTMLEERRF
ncbi:MAG: type II secretion system protein [Campylobacterales bacterium]|nr:type II secretion system protein [Campylobacterales bacterium]